MVNLEYTSVAVPSFLGWFCLLPNPLFLSFQKQGKQQRGKVAGQLLLVRTGTDSTALGADLPTADYTSAWLSFNFLPGQHQRKIAQGW